MGCAWWCALRVCVVSYDCGFWLFTGSPFTLDYVLKLFIYLVLSSLVFLLIACNNRGPLGECILSHV